MTHPAAAIVVVRLAAPSPWTNDKDNDKNWATRERCCMG
jgi:hypothetical protein